MVTPEIKISKLFQESVSRRARFTRHFVVRKTDPTFLPARFRPELFHRLVYLQKLNRTMLI